MTFVVSGLHVIYSGKRPLSGLDYITVDTQQPHVSILTISPYTYAVHRMTRLSRITTMHII